MPFSTVDYLACKNIHPDAPRMPVPGKDWYYTCLFHFPDHRPSLRINSDSGLWQCPVCQRKGNLESMILLLDYQGEYTETRWQLIQDYIRQRNTSSETTRGQPVSGMGRKEREREREPPQYANERQQDMLHLMQTWWHSCLLCKNAEAYEARTYLTRDVGIPASTLYATQQIGYAPRDDDNILLEHLVPRFKQRYGASWEELGNSIGLFTQRKGRRAFRNRFRVIFSCVHPRTKSVMYYQARWASKNIPEFLDGKKHLLKYLNPSGIAIFPFTIEIPSEQRDHTVQGTIGVESPKGPLALYSYGIPGFATLGSGMDWNLLDLFEGPLYWMQDADTPHYRKRADGKEEVYYPGDEQAQEAIRQCIQQAREAYRVRPPTRTKGVDEWLRDAHSSYPLLYAIRSVRDVPLHLPSLEKSQTEVVAVAEVESQLIHF